MIKDLLFNKVVNDEGISYLFCRWQDEKEYEVLEEYEAVLRKKYPNLLKIIDDPFTLTFKTGEREAIAIQIIDEGNGKLSYEGKEVEIAEAGDELESFEKEIGQ